jgi:hypothetical protein
MLQFTPPNYLFYYQTEDDAELSLKKSGTLADWEHDPGRRGGGNSTERSRCLDFPPPLRNLHFINCTLALGSLR